MRLILASASPRRAELLTAAGFRFEVRVTDVDEQVRPNEAPREYVRRLAREKAERAWEWEPPATAGQDECMVVGADTAVVVDGEILGKPIDDADAERMLRRIAGRTHLVQTGVSVRAADGHRDAVAETVVYVNPLADEELAWYLASGEGRDKAGAYAIQGLASRFIPRIEGSYSNVVGLPVEVVGRLLLRTGYGIRNTE
jgi:septum formation protein